jgi:hypothetical protein
MTTTETPTAKLLRLTAELQEERPEHTYLAVTRLIKDWPEEKAIAWLERGRRA